MIRKPKTYMARKEDVKRNCYLIDAKDQVLGRLAARAASILCGKHKAIFTPHVDTGDMVIIINAEKVRVTGRKLEQKVYQRFSGYPSGQKRVVLSDMLAKKPTQVIRLAISRMMPKSRLGSQYFTKVKIYAGDKHGHSAQKPILLEV